ncbi:MAG: hypothetical protein VCA36_12600 [Opitutales bacterium]
MANEEKVQEEKIQPIRSSDETRDCMLRLTKVIEDWASKESMLPGIELSAFGVTLAKNIIDFGCMRPGDLRHSQRIQSSIGTALHHLEREQDEMNAKIDQMHVRFAQEIEELNLRIVRDRKEFRRYVDTVRHSEEFGDLKKLVKKTADRIQDRMMATE